MFNTFNVLVVNLIICEFPKSVLEKLTDSPHWNINNILWFMYKQMCFYLVVRVLHNIQIETF
jgi:hypothetical protein